MQYDRISSEALRRMRANDITIFKAERTSATRVTSFQHRAGGKFKQETILGSTSNLLATKLLVVRCVVPCGG